MFSNVLHRTELIDGIETQVAAWCWDNFWTVSISRREWRCNYQVEGTFSKARTYEEAVAFAVKLAVDREALRTPESDERERFERLEQIARFRVDCEFADDVRAYRAALRKGKFAAEVMQEWRRNLETQTRSSLTFAWIMEHMDRQSQQLDEHHDNR